MFVPLPREGVFISRCSPADSRFVASTLILGSKWRFRSIGEVARATRAERRREEAVECSCLPFVPCLIPPGTLVLHQFELLSNSSNSSCQIHQNSGRLVFAGGEDVGGAAVERGDGGVLLHRRRRLPLHAQDPQGRRRPHPRRLQGRRTAQAPHPRLQVLLQDHRRGRRPRSRRSSATTPPACPSARARSSATSSPPRAPPTPTAPPGDVSSEARPGDRSAVCRQGTISSTAMRRRPSTRRASTRAS